MQCQLARQGMILPIRAHVFFAQLKLQLWLIYTYTYILYIIYIYICIHTYIYIYIFIYIHTYIRQLYLPAFGWLSSWIDRLALHSLFFLYSSPLEESNVQKKTKCFFTNYFLLSFDVSFPIIQTPLNSQDIIIYSLYIISYILFLMIAKGPQPWAPIHTLT